MKTVHFQSPLSVAKSKRNVENFVIACRRLGLPEVSRRLQWIFTIVRAHFYVLHSMSLFVDVGTCCPCCAGNLNYIHSLFWSLLRISFRISPRFHSGIVLIDCRYRWRLHSSELVVLLFSALIEAVSDGRLVLDVVLWSGGEDRGLATIVDA